MAIHSHSHKEWIKSKKERSHSCSHSVSNQRLEGLQKSRYLRVTSDLKPKDRGLPRLAGSGETESTTAVGGLVGEWPQGMSGLVVWLRGL